MKKNRDEMRLGLPYGIWTTKEGTKVLFNRKYQPIWVKYPSGQIAKPDPNWWVRDIVTQEYYYDDGCPPYGDKRKTETKNTWKRIVEGLNKFGIRTIKLESPRAIRE